MVILENRHDRDRLLLEGTPDKRHLIWEIESRCTLACRYCYSNRTRSGAATPERIGELIREIAKSDVQHVHLTGGEPLLSPYLEEIVAGLSGKTLYITTNLTEGIDRLKRLLTAHSVYSLAASVDALDPTVGDTLRGKTATVLQNLQELLSFRREAGIKTKIRMHCVVSGKNLCHVPELLDWAHAQGVDEVSCQPVSIETGHRYFDELHLSADDLPQLSAIWEAEERLFGSHYSRSHSALVEYYLKHRDCFVEDHTGLGIPFIDACGSIWSCAGKKRRLADLGESGKGTRCDITMQCMTCLKHLALAKGDNNDRF